MPSKEGRGWAGFYLSCHLGKRYPLDLEVAATFVVTIVGPSCFRMGASMQVLSNMNCVAKNELCGLLFLYLSLHLPSPSPLLCVCEGGGCEWNLCTAFWICCIVI